MKEVGSRKSILVFLGIISFVRSGFCNAGFPEVQDTAHHRIDTHIHLYDTRRAGSSVFLDPVVNAKIYFPHLGEQFVDTAGPAGVEYAVVIEASQRREDNYWLMAHVDTTEALVAFIANLDPRDPTYKGDLDSLSKSRKFRGIRIRPATSIDISDPVIIKSFVELARRNLVLELGGNGYDPQVVATIARRFPNMNIIMNHLAGGTLSGNQIQPADWKARLAVFASEPNVYCKVSALYEASGQNPAPLNSASYDALIDPVVAAFGPDRVLFGSNWSLSDMLGSYKDMITMLDDYCSRKNLSPEKLFYDNANKAYGINQKAVIHSGNGKGLLRTYWNGKIGGREWFTDYFCSAIDPDIDESWGTNSPGCGVRNVFWNARWEGLLEPLSTENYTFYLTVNGYARVWVDSKLLIDQWAAGSGNACYKGSVELIAGQQVPVKVEYADFYDEAFIRLEWESPGLNREVVPVNQLYPPIVTDVARNHAEDGGFSVFPNPADNRILISGNDQNLDEVKISNIQGVTVYENNAGSHELELTVSGWPCGLYFVEVRGLNGRSVKKIMINN